MNLKQLGLLNDTYKRYYDEMIKTTYNDNSVGITRPYTQEEFINKCKTDNKFSKKWQLKIEERELSNDERFRIAYKNLYLRKELETQSKMLHYPDGHNKAIDDANIPTKLITITYKDKTVESYY